MLSNFQRIFKPTPWEKAADHERLKKLHQEQIGHCSTCIHYICSNMPCFVTDYGECKVNNSLFSKKVCGLSEEDCPDYKEKEK